MEGARGSLALNTSNDWLRRSLQKFSFSSKMGFIPFLTVNGGRRKPSHTTKHGGKLTCELDRHFDINRLGILNTLWHGTCSSNDRTFMV